MLSRNGRLRGSPPPAPLATAQALHGVDMALSWEQWETCGKTAWLPWPRHCHPGPPALQEPSQQHSLPRGVSSYSSPCPRLTAGTVNSGPVHFSPRLTANLAST